MGDPQYRKRGPRPQRLAATSGSPRPDQACAAAPRLRFPAATGAVRSEGPWRRPPPWLTHEPDPITLSRATGFPRAAVGRPCEPCLGPRRFPKRHFRSAGAEPLAFVVSLRLRVPPLRLLSPPPGAAVAAVLGVKRWLLPARLSQTPASSGLAFRFWKRALPGASSPLRQPRPRPEKMGRQHPWHTLSPGATRFHSCRFCSSEARLGSHIDPLRMGTRLLSRKPSV